MRYGRIILVLCLTLWWTGAPLRAQEEALPAVPAAGDRCPVCGMFVARTPDFLAQIAFKDGSRVFFDGVKDMMKYYLNLSKYGNSRKVTDIDAFFVTDYYLRAPIDGLNPYYVVGSSVYGPMGKELIPFKDEADAREFRADHQGKAIFTFNQISSEVLQGLD